MRAILTLTGTFSILCASAQISISETDMPSAGDTMRYSTIAAQGIDVLSTGAGYTWDMSLLVPQGSSADTAVTVGSTPLLYQFYFNNQILYPQHKADYAQKGPSFGAQGLQVSDVYEYYKKGTDGFRNVGFGASINGVPASVRRIPVDVVYEFPMNFGDVSSSSSFFELTVPTLLYYSQSQQRDNVVDGWGTLNLPTNTFQVLRVKSVVQHHDSVYIEQFGTGFGFDQPETIEYKWLAAGMDAPILIVTTVGGAATTARFFYDNSIVTTIVENEQLTPKIYPNPVSDMLSISIPNKMTGIASIHDASGREIRGGIRLNGTDLLKVDVAQLEPGTYVLRSVGGERPWSKNFVVSH
ncbi:MAG: T9SS type A sorting domain-containing protein [Flavobacteriales bacterium]|nr:T9SS type A sorting domain-containing protein [Flavobacteriales bacterium]MBK6945049.1 T9SS type A sorting domain-containing protein [Flavobacteriales bacterium]HQV51429.1 T9SS type A sorting domain-containing protein [Flavobacteriales bacterium]